MRRTVEIIAQRDETIKWFDVGDGPYRIYIAPIMPFGHGYIIYKGIVILSFKPLVEMPSSHTTFKDLLEHPDNRTLYEAIKNIVRAANAQPKNYSLRQSDKQVICLDCYSVIERMIDIFQFQHPSTGLLVNPLCQICWHKRMGEDEKQRPSW